MSEERQLVGGCHCGAVRYRLTGEPLMTTVCHCADCRRVHGAPMVAWVSFRTTGLEVLRGELRSYRSSDRAVRRFCGECGTPLTFQYDAHPHWIDIAHGTLDDPEAVQPAAHIWCRSRLSWVKLADDLPCYEEGPQTS